MVLCPPMCGRGERTPKVRRPNDLPAGISCSGPGVKDSPTKRKRLEAREDALRCSMRQGFRRGMRAIGFRKYATGSAKNSQQNDESMKTSVHGYCGVSRPVSGRIANTEPAEAGGRLSALGACPAPVQDTRAFRRDPGLPRRHRPGGPGGGGFFAYVTVGPSNEPYPRAHRQAFGKAAMGLCPGGCFGNGNATTIHRVNRWNSLLRVT